MSQNQAHDDAGRAHDDAGRAAEARLVAAEVVAEAGIGTRVKRFGLQDTFAWTIGKYEELKNCYGMTAEAIVKFRAVCPTIKRTGSANYGPGKTNYTYAQLPAAVEQIQKLMQECQLAATWQTPEQTPVWIQVKCTITHVLGHSESTTLGGPPDTSGSKNQLQAIKSCWSYLRRTTLFSLLGLVDKDEVDDDGDGGKKSEEKKATPIASDEDKAKTAFWNACKKKAGVDFSATQARDIFAKVQSLSGKTAAADCLAFLSQENVLRSKNGTIAQDMAEMPDESQATPAGRTPEDPSPLPPEPPSSHSSQPWVCDECGVGYPVKTAGGKCLTKGCFGQAVKGR